MKSFIILLFTFCLLCSCVGHPLVQQGYGVYNSYYDVVGDGRHPGIDYGTPVGYPIIACSDGFVYWIGEPEKVNELLKSIAGGFFVIVRHDNEFFSTYGHLSKVVVEFGQDVKRGQLVGLSGKSNNGNPHLHFGISPTQRSKVCKDTYDPNKFWLGGKPECFDPSKDYSTYSRREITLPVACKKYKK